MDLFPVLYFLGLFALAALLLLILRSAQKTALSTLREVLYRDGDSRRYLAMLESRRLGLVLRKSTLALLRLEGHIQAEDREGVAADEAALRGIKLRGAERLDWGQKCLSYYLNCGEYCKAREYLAMLEELLDREPDEKLQAILADARLLVGIYADRDVNLISELEVQAGEQSGHRKGITLYRLAKLLHFKGDEAAAGERLCQAAEFLGGTPWAPIVEEARRDHAVLDAR